ncbi:TPA: MarR family transcriptional regulator [Staphylococcus aureus]|nr:MarR family transcriptional regulator [Staphylococcus aureus]
MYVENSYLSKQLCFLFYVSSKEIIKKYTNYLKDYDLTYTGYIVLMAIENDEKLNIKKLGERVFLDSGTLTPLLKKLEKKDYVVRTREEKDYVVRTREEKDERNLQISLTEQGKAIKSPLAEISVKVFNEFNISEREASDIVHNLRNFVSKNFDNSDKK